MARCSGTSEFRPHLHAKWGHDDDLEDQLLEIPACIASSLPPVQNHPKENAMSLGTILLIVLILMLVGAIPSWPHSRGWGYGPSGGLGLVVIILLVLLLMGRI